MTACKPYYQGSNSLEGKNKAWMGERLAEEDIIECSGHECGPWSQTVSA